MLSTIILNSMQEIENKYSSGDDRWKALKAHLHACKVSVQCLCPHDDNWDCEYNNNGECEISEQG